MPPPHPFFFKILADVFEMNFCFFWLLCPRGDGMAGFSTWTWTQPRLLTTEPGEARGGRWAISAHSGTMTQSSWGDTSPPLWVNAGCHRPVTAIGVALGFVSFGHGSGTSPMRLPGSWVLTLQKPFPFMLRHWHRMTHLAPEWHILEPLKPSSSRMAHCCTVFASLPWSILGEGLVCWCPVCV